MDNDNNATHNVRGYVRSLKFRMSSLLGFALIVSSFFVPDYRYWLLSVGIALSLLATISLLGYLPLGRKVDLAQRRDKQMLLFAVIYVAIIIGLIFYWTVGGK